MAFDLASDWEDPWTMYFTEKLHEPDPIQHALLKHQT